MKRIVTALILTISTSLPVLAQATQASSFAPPSLPVIPRYQYWPQQYVLFVGPELPYSIAEFYADPSAKTPIYDLVLVDRQSGKRVSYSNDSAVVMNETAFGNEAHKTEIQYQQGETTNVGSISTINLTLPDGRPLLWRFVAGSDISERGSGLIPMPQMPMPVLAYREQGALAGEGTAIQIGGTVSQAGVWNEMSQPPYFIAYHGGYAESAQRLVFISSQQQWTTVSAPAKFEPGQAWELTSSKGIRRTLHIQSVSGASVVLNGTDQNNEQVHFLVNATYNGGAWAVESIRFAPVKDGERHFADLHFSPAFGSDATEVAIEVSVGKRTRLASGTVTVSGPQIDRLAVLAFKKPDWLSPKSVTFETKIADAAVNHLTQR